MTLVLECRDLAVGRAGAPILSGIDLDVVPGERLALVGANGSGKTTLLRSLAGLDPPLGGEVRWEGGPLGRGAARVKTLGVLFQEEAQARFSVREMVTLGLGLDGRPGRDTERLVERALEQAELGALAGRSCSQISGGEWQRVLLARSLVAGPRLLLLDEPTNHLDPAHRATLEAELDRLRGSVAVVLATHDLGLAANCERVLLLARGATAAVGAASDVLTPENLARALGIRVRRVEDPAGGPPFLRVVGACRDELAA